MRTPLKLALALWFVAAGPALAAPEPGPISDALKQAQDGLSSRYIKGPGQPAALPGRPGVWLRFSNHNHSAYWDGDVSLGHMQVAAFNAGLDAMAITDHNTMRGTTSHEFTHPPDGMVMVRGMEWNSWIELGEKNLGHATLLGLDGDQSIPSGAGLDDMLAEATRRHGTIIINHPFCWRLTWAQPTPDPRAHAVEIWNGWWYLAKPLMNNDTALAWWEEALRRGQRLTAVAGTDHHGRFYDDVARNVNMVFAETLDEAGILKGIREGHVAINAGVGSGSVYMEADRDGDGVFDSMMGDQLPMPAGGQVSVRARVLGGQGEKVVFYTAKGRVAVASVDSQDATIPLTVSLRDGHDYVRAELRPSPDLPFSMSSISNPIYFGTPPAAEAPAAPQVEKAP